VLSLILDGLSAGDIAQTLTLSEDTVQKLLQTAAVGDGGAQPCVHGGGNIRLGSEKRGVLPIARAVPPAGSQSRAARRRLKVSHCEKSRSGRARVAHPRPGLNWDSRSKLLGLYTEKARVDLSSIGRTWPSPKRQVQCPHGAESLRGLRSRQLNS